MRAMSNSRILDRCKIKKRSLILTNNELKSEDIIRLYFIGLCQKFVRRKSDMSSKSNTQAMETEKIPRLLAQLAIPAVVAQIINLLYNIVDRIYIGHIPGVGAAALTGVGLFTPILMLINAFAMLAGSGGAPRPQFPWGKRTMRQRKRFLETVSRYLFLWL